MAGSRTRRPSRRATLSRWAYWVHGLAGLKLGVVLAVVMVTGTLAVFGHEWDWLFGPYQRVVPEGEPAGLAKVYETVRETHPRYAILRVEAPRGPRSAAPVRVVTPERQYRRVYVDPYKRKVVGDADLLSAQTFFRQIHMSLLLPKYGRLFVSALSILTLVSLISGLLCYKRFWRGFLKIPRTRNLRLFLGDCHRLAAVWSIWFLALMALTGLWYFYESLDTFGTHTDVPRLSAQSVPRTEGGPPERIAMAEAVRIAKDELNDFDPTRLVIPRGPRDPVEIAGRTNAWLVRPRASVVALDPYSGEVIHRRTAANLSWKARLHEAVDPLHFGTFGGFATKLIWFVFGAAMSFLSISGIVIYTRRLTNRAYSRPKQANRGETTGDTGEWGAGVT